MNKTAIKNFAIWARNKLIADISYRAGLMGITASGIHAALSQSTGQTEFYDIGTAEPFAISGEAIQQRRHLVELIKKKEKETNYKTAYKYVIEEVAYTWFNRLIAVRFMEVNDYLPSHIRVLSSDTGKMEPDLVTTPFEAELEFTRSEQQMVVNMKNENKLDEVFRLLFIKQCNALNEILPALFEKTNDYTELLLNLSVIDQDGVVYHLVHDIPEADFDVERGGQVEIIGWLYQYYNTEPKNEAFSKKGKISKEEIPAVTQLFTPDWIVRYMVENSLGRLWVEGHPNDNLKAEWKYYLEEAEQEPEVQAQLSEIRAEYAKLNPKDIKVIDPCMGSGHILVYAFDVLMQIYESAGYGQRDAAISILENNLYGLDIDDRAFQMAYFSVMMKARQYNRRIINGEYKPNLYAILESNEIDRNQLKYLGGDISDEEKRIAISQLNYLLNTFKDAKEYGAILCIEQCNWDLLYRFISNTRTSGQLSIDAIGLDETINKLLLVIAQGRVLADKYNISITNPPYMVITNGDNELQSFVKENYPNSKADLYAVFIERLCQFTAKKGLFAMITMHAWMFLSSFEKLRFKLNDETLLTMAHLGARAFDSIGGEVVQTTAFIFGNYKLNTYCGKYDRLISGISEKEKEKLYTDGEHRYIASQSSFSKIPGTPFAYWLPVSFINIFNEESLGSTYRISQGMSSADNNRFLRLWTEVENTNIVWGCMTEEESKKDDRKWYPLNKGGEFRKWYGNRSFIVNYQNNGAELKAFPNAYVRNSDAYFKPFITWSKVSTSEPAFRAFEHGFIFSDAGMSIIINDDNSLKLIIGLLNSKITTEILKVYSPTMNFEAGHISRIPVIKHKSSEKRIIEIVGTCLNISKADWDAFEESWDYKRNKLAGGITMGRLIADKYMEWEQECENRFQQLKMNEEELNRIFIDIYGLQDELTPEVDEKDVTVRKADLQRDIKSLISYAVGCMFGRYSLDVDGLVYAGGRWESGKYKSFIPDRDNIIPITDEEYLEDDIVARLCEWLKVVYGADTLEDNLEFIAKALGNKGDSSREIIRNYFLSDFFRDHCQTYSVTGSGKRPIYWLFDSGKQNGFKALIYLHRYNADTIGNLRIDYLHRMQRVYESEISRMQDMIEHTTNAREVARAIKRREKLTKQLKECREYDEKMGHLALSRIVINLDDGVKVNYRKIQTANDGKLYEVLADSKMIMAKEK